MNVLLIIDPQNDFCRPADENGENKGALYVPGADDDMKRLAFWTIANAEKIDHIVVTLDTHHLNDISHPGFWTDKNNKTPQPFTKITLEDIENEIWIPMIEKERVKLYFERLKEQKEYDHIIWPEHCLVGSEGAAIYKPILDSINTWARRGRFFQPVFKGEYPLSEHFGAFAAQVAFDDIPDTQVNAALIDELGQFDNIFLGGEAKSHCVANTVKQLIDFAPGIVSKLRIFKDAMSSVPGFENLADNIYAQAEQLGATFISTAEMIE